MRKRVLFTVLGMLLISLVQAQEKTNDKKRGYWQLKTGLGYLVYQDAKSSRVKYTGVGVPFSIYHGRISDKNLSSGGLDLQLGTVGTEFNEETKYSVTDVKFYFNYLKKLPISGNFIEHWYLGGEIDARFRFFRNNSSLVNNNQINYLLSHSLSVVNRFERDIKLFNKDVRLSHELSLGILSLVKEEISFGFSAPQGGLEDGDFNYQDFEDNGLYSYAELKTFDKFNSIRSRIALDFPAKKENGNSWGFAYEWQMVSNIQLSNYGLTKASHAFIVSYTLPKKK